MTNLTIELVVWKVKEGISVKQSIADFSKLNSFVQQQPGFISRRTGLSKENQFVDIVLWTDQESALNASKKVAEIDEFARLFTTIDESSMLFQHFDTFNFIEA